MADVDAVIDGHRRRNVQLAESLRSKGIDLEAPRDIELHFWAKDQDAATRLAKSLEDRSFLVTALATTNAQGGWNVEGRKRLRPSQVMSEAFVREVAELAASSEAEFDGWGTRV